MAGVPESQPLQPSRLGTKDYWDSTYASELSNFTTNPTDEGTIWFSDSAAEEKILAYLTSEPVIPSPATWLDLGTGNGHLMFLLHNTLADEGKVGDKLVGVDYSDKSIELARSIAKERGLGADDVRFVMWDIMRDEPGASWVPKEGFDVVLDKGTLDAVSLSEEVGKDGRNVLEEYRRRVAELIRRGGLFLITSCNWTEKELWGIFEAGGELVYHSTIKYPSFTFGGRKGQTVSSVCFRRKLGGA